MELKYLNLKKEENIEQVEYEKKYQKYYMNMKPLIFLKKRK